MEHLSTAALTAGLDEVRRSPADHGRIDLIVARPDVGERLVLEEGELDLAVGLIGDTWSERGSRSTADGSPHPEMQLNITGARTSMLLAGVDAASRARFGDQLHLDLDLSEDNLPAGTRLALGTAVIEITPSPHTGCAKFTERFGLDAMRFVNAHGLRGRCARVVVPGTVRRGDAVTKIPVAAVLA